MHTTDSHGIKAPGAILFVAGLTLIVSLSLRAHAQNAPAPHDNPNRHELGDRSDGQAVFRMETFGNEGFWTDAARLPAGMIASRFTPLDALKAGLSVNIDALDAATKRTLARELTTDLSAANAPALNDPATTVALINANAVIGVVAKDSNGNGRIDITAGDKVGIACAFCHAVTDRSVFSLPNGGSIGKQVDGPTPHFLNVGASLALAANSRAFYPLAQLALSANGGKTLGRAPQGLTEQSTETEFDAYFSNPAFYPIGMFDDAPDGNGAPMHITPMFRADLAAPWGSDGAISKLDNFSNLVYTALFDPTHLTTPGGRAFMHKLGGAAGDEIVEDYVKVLAATGVTGYPFVRTATTGTPVTEPTPLGVRVDNSKLLDLNAYMSALPAPAGAKVDRAAAKRGEALFRASCTACHKADQRQIVGPMIVPMKTIFPGDNPVTLASRTPPLNPVMNTVANVFDDKMAVVNASLRGLERGIALPLLLDLARKPVFLHDNSVPDLEMLLNPSRGAASPHPFFLKTPAERRDMVAFLRGVSTK